MIDISHLLRFCFFEPVLYKVKEGWPSSQEKPGWFVGFANNVGDAFVDAGSAIGDFFGGLGKRSAGEVLYYGDYVYYEVEGSDDDHYHEDSGNDYYLAETLGYY